MRRLIALVMALIVVSGATSMAVTASTTAVPGHQGRTGTVTGHYTTEAEGCTYIVNYRGDFGPDPYLDNGWIMNNISCPDGQYHYLIVHQSDRRYTGNPDWAIWGSWEIIVYTESGEGNLVRRPERPETHVGG